MAAALKSDYSYQIEEDEKNADLFIERLRKLIFKNGAPQKEALKPDFAGTPLRSNDGQRVKTSSKDDSKING